MSDICCKRIFDQSMSSLRHCGKPAMVERNGRHYCGLHDPERLMAVRAKNEAIVKAERDRKNAEWELAKATKQ